MRSTICLWLSCTLISFLVCCSAWSSGAYHPSSHPSRTSRINRSYALKPGLVHRVTGLRAEAGDDADGSGGRNSALPRHVAFIVDGNGRWAIEKGLRRQDGHSRGANVTVEVAKSAFRSGIPYLTFFLFSTENWARPSDEVANIMKLLEKYLGDVSSYLVENGIKLVVIGQIDRLPPTSQALIKAVEKSTEGFNGQTLCLALSYSGRDDIVRACRSIQKTGVSPTSITEEVFNRHLSLGSRSIPDPDLLIRTSGEQRLSNFLLYQAAYSELAFHDSYWPDFSPEKCQNIIDSFTSRKRRYGGVDPH
jgi:undecaprenyl diphosphate synthase